MITQILFFFFAACAGGSALAMVTRRNPVSSAIWLIGTFFSVAAIYTLLGAFFIGIIQILVYAGAIMVLFLFVIMLLNLGNDFAPDARGTAWKVLGGGSGLLILALLARVFFGYDPQTATQAAQLQSMQVAQAAIPDPLPMPDSLAILQEVRGAVGLIGIPLYEDYVVPLQATAILLLIAVVGAVVLAKRKF